MQRHPSSTRAAGLILVAVAFCGATACNRGRDLDSEDPERRAAAVRALTRSGDRDLAALLVAQRDPSPVVRRAAAEVFSRRGGPSAAVALGKLLGDPDPAVIGIAARGLAAMSSEPHAKEALVTRYAGATPAGRAAIAEALDRIGVSLREAVELEAKLLWERDLAALENGRGRVRAGAAEEVGASGRAEAVQRLLPLVDPNRNPDRALAAAAARGLGEAGDWASRQHLETLLSEPDASLAEAAAEALGRLGDPAGADALAAAAAAGSGRLAAVAVEALSALPQAPEVGLALCEVAARTLDPKVAARAARQARLREAECPEKVFLGRLGRPGQELPALEALGELGLHGARAEAAAQRIAALLDPGRGDAALRAAAARATARIGWAGSGTMMVRRASALLQRFSEMRARWIPGRLPQNVRPGFEKGGEARLAAILDRPLPGHDLGPAEPGEPAIPEWTDRVSGADAEELGALAAGAGQLRADGAAAMLPVLARDPLPAVRAGAIEGLGGIGGDAALAEVRRALSDPSPAVRRAAAEAGARFGARAVPALAEAIDRAAAEDVEWRIALAQALGETGAPEAIAPLAALVRGPSAQAAAAALARIGTPAAAKPLVELLADPATAARIDAIEALAQVGAPEGGPAIAGQLTSDRPEVRAAAARALGRLRYEAASVRLEALRSDYDGRVRRAAVEALAKLPAGVPKARR